MPDDNNTNNSNDTITWTISWDNTGEKRYETGVERVVLFPTTDQGTYGSGVAWNGVTAITASNTGGDETALWADDIKYASLRSAEEFGGTIEAYQCPDEFYQCDGSATPASGVIVGQQSRRAFGLSYETIIGNDVKGTDYGRLIHIVYGATASPSERSYQTINDSPDAITLSWEFKTTPVPAVGNLKPTAHIIIDDTKATELAATVRDMLYTGTLPLPSQIISNQNNGG